MNKIKMGLALALTFCMLLSSTVFAADDISGHWAQASLSQAIENGWVRDEGVGLFRPDDFITRAEFIGMVNRMMGFEGSADLSEFSDVSESDWFYETFSIAVAAGYVSGYGGGKLGPNELMTRTYAFVIFARFMGLDIDEDNTALVSGINDFNTVPYWAENSVLALVAEGFVNGTGGGNISGQRNLTRAEAATLLVRNYNDVKAFVFAGHYFMSDASSVTIGGDGITVEIAADAEIDMLTVESGSANVRVIMDEGSAFNFANLRGPANIFGEGTIGTANITSQGVVIAAVPGAVNLIGGVSAVIGGQTVGAGIPAPASDNLSR